MSGAVKELAGLLYGGCRPLRQQKEFPHPLRGRDFRFFAYGRHAIFEAFILAGVGKGDVVLLPEYICGETLSAVKACGANVEYYPVDNNLELAVPPESLPRARAVVAINYFGFDQPLTKFEAYCIKNSAVLIEDNAHGFLGQDDSGKYLGTRGDVGIFSFRKSIPLVNGSGIVINHPDKVLPFRSQLPFVHHVRSRTFLAKKLLRQFPQWNMVKLLYGMIRLDRRLRKFRTGNDYVRSGVEDELVLPGSPEPYAGLLQALKSLDVDCEIARRRRLYLGLQKLVGDSGGLPVFPVLPDHVVPYGLPFRASREQIEPIREALRKQHLDCYLWPELPQAIQKKWIERYQSVWLVNFIW